MEAVAVHRAVSQMGWGLQPCVFCKQIPLDHRDQAKSD